MFSYPFDVMRDKDADAMRPFIEMLSAIIYTY